MIFKPFFVLLLPIIALSNPSWLYNINNNNKYDIVGYGIADTLLKAKQNAISEITNTISVEVDTSVNISTSDTNGIVNQDASTNLKTKSQAILSGVKFIKVEQLNDMWYVAAKYDNSPIEIKLKKLLPSNLENEVQNCYLKNTPLISELNTQINKKLNYKIIRKDNLWQLKYRDILIPLNKQNFYKLFSNKSTNKLSIIPNQKIYKENDEMFFKINTEKDGYVSILYVEYNGKVGVLLANKKAKKTFLYPDLKSEDRFKIVNPYHRTIRELYIAIYSELPIDLYEFENVSDNLLDESNYNFDHLISKLNNLQFSTFEIKIRK